MRCDDAERAVMRRAAGRLDPAGVQRLEAHLDGCPACREAAGSQQEVAAILSARPDAAPPLGFATRVMAHLDSPPTWLDVINWRRWTVRLAPVAAVLLVVAAVGFGPADAVEPIEFSDLVTDWAEADGTPPAFSLLWQDDVADDTLLEAVLTANPDAPF
jgi:anti-sigma factor RsiW